MLKEVGASGQISLGKKYAGQLFELDVQANGDILMRPVKVVPVHSTVQEPQPTYRVPPEAQQLVRDWAEEHASQIDQYNQWATQNEPYSQRVRRWRAQGEGTPS